MHLQDTRHIRILALLAFCSLVTGCSGRVCELINDSGEFADLKGRTTLVKWNPILKTVSLGHMPTFHKGDSYTTKMAFSDTGFHLAYNQGTVSCRDENCEKRIRLTIERHYLFRKEEGRFGTLYEWSISPLPPVVDADGDGIIPPYEQIAPDRWESQDKLVWRCKRRGTLLDWLVTMFLSAS